MRFVLFVGLFIVLSSGLGVIYALVSGGRKALMKVLLVLGVFIALFAGYVGLLIYLDSITKNPYFLVRW